MDKVELYRQVFNSFKALCAKGKQPGSFRSYCLLHAVDQSQMPLVLKKEFQKVTTLYGYRRQRAYNGSDKRTCVGLTCAKIYEEFKRLCVEGKQPGTFKSFYEQWGITRRQMKDYLWRNRLKVVGLPGFVEQRGFGPGKCQEVPFENVIFEEAGFLPAEGNLITISVYGHVAVTFPADTDVETVAKFVRKIRKEVGHVES